MVNASHKNIIGTLQDELPSAMMDGNRTTAAMPVEPDVKLISDAVLNIVYQVITVRMEPVINAFGVLNNILILIVFYKIGFKETANITLSAIAFWDLVKCIGIFLFSFAKFLKLFPRIPPSIYYSYLYITFGITDMAEGATHVSSVLAAYVAIERSLCVTMPFTAKYLLTRKFATIACVTISVLVSGSYSLNYAVMQFEIRRSRNNFTYIYYPKLSQFVQDNYYSYNLYVTIIDQLYPSAALSTMCVSTVLIVHQLRKSSELRSKMGITGSKQLSSRDAKITRMLVAIILVYIIYFLPWFAFYLFPYIFPSKDGKTPRFLNMLSLLYRITKFLSTFNASVNIYILYFMSSDFNQTLKKIFHLPVKAKSTRK